MMLMMLSNKYNIDFLSRVAQLLHWHYTIADGRVREIFLPLLLGAGP